jgi:hypothetical protein
LDSDNFPDDQNWKEFKELLHETTKHPASGDEGSLEATVSRMTDEEAQNAFRSRWAIFSEIAQAYGLKRGERGMGSSLGWPFVAMAESSEMLTKAG